MLFSVGTKAQFHVVKLKDRLGRVIPTLPEFSTVSFILFYFYPDNNWLWDGDSPHSIRQGISH